MDDLLRYCRILPWARLRRVDLRGGTHAAYRLLGRPCRCSNSSGGWRRIVDAHAVEGLEYSASPRWSGDLWSGIYRIGRSNIPSPLGISLQSGCNKREAAPVSGLSHF